jgi:xylulokinase
VRPGILEVTLGTAAVPLCFSARSVRDPKRRVTCCAHAVPGRWEVEGLQNAAGGSLKWLGDALFRKGGTFPDGFWRGVAEIPPGANGVLFYPYLAGSAAPHWDPEATGMFLGLAHAHDPCTLARAVMEGVTMETREILDVFSSLKIPLREVRLTGGYTAVNVWNQIQADVYGKRVSTLEEPQATLLGAGMLAAVGVGAYGSLPEAAEHMVRVRRQYCPARERVASYEKLYRKYRRVYRKMYQARLFHAVQTPV